MAWKHLTFKIRELASSTEKKFQKRSQKHPTVNDYLSIHSLVSNAKKTKNKKKHPIWPERMYLQFES